MAARASGSYNSNGVFDMVPRRSRLFDLLLRDENQRMMFSNLYPRLTTTTFIERPTIIFDEDEPPLPISMASLVPSPDVTHFKPVVIDRNTGEIVEIRNVKHRNTNYDGCLVGTDGSPIVLFTDITSTYRGHLFKGVFRLQNIPLSESEFDKRRSEVVEQFDQFGFPENSSTTAITLYMQNNDSREAISFLRQQFNDGLGQGASNERTLPKEVLALALESYARLMNTEVLENMLQRLKPSYLVYDGGEFDGQVVKLDVEGRAIRHPVRISQPTITASRITGETDANAGKKRKQSRKRKNSKRGKKKTFKTR